MEINLQKGFKIQLWLCVALMSLGLSNSLMGQVSFQIINSETKEAVPYATVLSLSTGRGWAANYEGFVEVSPKSLDDTVLIRCVGYEDARILVKDIGDSKFLLSPKSYNLKTVSILGDNALLYDLIAEVRRKKGYQTVRGKCYFNLQSFTGEERIELLEQYGNAKISNGELIDIDYKIGRLGNLLKNNRFWISSESSKAILYHKNFDSPGYFPSNPLNHGKRSNKKLFNLFLLGRYKEDGSVFYRVGFDSKLMASEFNGELLLDSNNMVLKSVKLNCSNCNKHPFAAIGKGKVQSVDMQINKGFDSRGRLTQVDFNYNVNYRLNEVNEWTVTTTAGFFIYDYEDLFNLPFFNFSEGMHSDYGKINATPYNDDFWRKHQEFSILSKENESQAFINQHVKNEKLHVFENPGWEKAYETPYLKWSPTTRISFSHNISEAISKPNMGQTVIGKDNVVEKDIQIHSQIFLDFNTLKDSLHILCSTVLDPNETYLRVEKNPYTDVIFNLGFDEMEIARRKFIVELDPSMSFPEIESLYKLHSIQAQKKIDRLVFDCRNGEDQAKLKAWNNKVYQELGIDNLAIFGL